MPFQKGVKPAGSGRKPGSPNKRDVKRQEIFERIIKKRSVEITGPDGGPIEARLELVGQITDLIGKLNAGGK